MLITMILSFPTLNGYAVGHRGRVTQYSTPKLLIHGSASAIRASNNSAYVIGVDLVEISFSQHHTTHLPSGHT